MTENALRVPVAGGAAAAAARLSEPCGGSPEASALARAGAGAIWPPRRLSLFNHARCAHFDMTENSVQTRAIHYHGCEQGFGSGAHTGRGNASPYCPWASNDKSVQEMREDVFKTRIPAKMQVCMLFGIQVCIARFQTD